MSCSKLNVTFVTPNESKEYDPEWPSCSQVT
jgi:hypothetical protein